MRPCLTPFPSPLDLADRGIVCMQDIAGHDIGLYTLDQGYQCSHCRATPIDQRGVRDIGAHALKNLVLTIKRDMIVELGREDVSQEARSGHGVWDRAARSRFSHNLLAATAGLLDPCDLDDFQLCRDHVDQLADILTRNAQIATAILAAITGVEFPAFARGIFRDARAAAR